MSSDPETARARARVAAAVALAVLAALWVHGRCLTSFFTSPDDLVYLEQASGLVPTPHKLFRYLSEVLYFRVMFGIFGLRPLPYHAVTTVVHLLNIALVFRFAIALGIGRRAAVLGAALFGVFPLFSSVISSAVGINDELALALALSALLAIHLRGVAGPLLSGALFTLAMLSKESVVFLPLLPLLSPAWERSGPGRARLGVLLAIAAVGIVLLSIVRPIGLAPDPAVYAVHFGGNVFHNLMTYASWSVNLVSPEPDLVGSFDPRAWRVGIWVVLGALASLWAFARAEPAIGIGLAWFVLGLLPVLPLEHLTYRHYLYPAFPGLALAVAGSALRSLEWLARHVLRGRSSKGAAAAWRLAGALSVAGTLAYAANAHRLVQERFDARVPGTNLALDPIHRRRELAEQAIVSLQAQLRPDQTRIAILEPEGTSRVFGARSGREYRPAQGGARAYDLLEESLDHGRAIRLYYRWVDSVAFISRWTPDLRDFDLFLPAGAGSLAGFGRGPTAHGEVAKWMMEHGWYPQARDHLRVVLEAYPSDAGLRLGYGAALYRTGDRAAAVEQLREIVRTAPGDSVAAVARSLLARLDSTAARP